VQLFHRQFCLFRHYANLVHRLAWDIPSKYMAWRTRPIRRGTCVYRFFGDRAAELGAMKALKRRDISCACGLRRRAGGIWRTWNSAWSRGLTRCRGGFRTVVDGQAEIVKIEEPVTNGTGSEFRLNLREVP
jgi:hypothetical protein